MYCTNLVQSCPASVSGTPHHPDWPGHQIFCLTWKACSLHPPSCQEPALIPTAIGMLLGMDLLLVFQWFFQYISILFHWWCVHTVDADAHVVSFSWPFGMSAALRSSSSSGCRPHCAGYLQVCTEPKRAGGTWSYESLEDGWRLHSLSQWLNWCTFGRASITMQQCHKALQ